MMQKLLISLVFISLISAASAQDKPSFGLPIDCNIGTNCWIMNYVDMDIAEDSFKDPLCGPRGYDGHKGTDFAIQSKVAMDQGVRVLAAEDGIIDKVRNGEPDRFASPQDIAESIEARKECGNAILIDHGDALKTIYCHMKKDSITVEAGQNVKAGDVIGEIGLSGVTEFPHLHFGILWEGATIDPFTGQSNTQGCDTPLQPLWDSELNLKYTPTSIYHAGFSNRIPKIKDIDMGEHVTEELTQDQPLLTFWFSAFGVQQDDKISMRITAPDGSVFSERNIAQPKTRSRQFYYVGKRTENEPLAAGPYTGVVQISREIQNEEPLLYTMEKTLIITD